MFPCYDGSRRCAFIFRQDETKNVILHTIGVVQAYEIKKFFFLTEELNRLRLINNLHNMLLEFVIKTGIMLEEKAIKVYICI